MALYMFTLLAEGGSNDRAFAQAQQHPAMAGRTHYQILNPMTVFPSDKHALSRAEDAFGVQPQADKVSIAGESTNTVWAGPQVERSMSDPRDLHRISQLEAEVRKLRQALRALAGEVRRSVPEDVAAGQLANMAFEMLDEVPPTR